MSNDEDENQDFDQVLTMEERLDILLKIEELNLRLFGGWTPKGGWSNDVPSEIRMSSILGMLNAIEKKVNHVIITQRLFNIVLFLIVIFLAISVVLLWK